MGIFDAIKNAVAKAPEAAPAAPTLPTLAELGNMILKSQLLFRQTLAEAEASAAKAMGYYRKKFTAAPEQRTHLAKLQADQDRITRQKMIQAQAAAKNTAMLQDVEIVMKIDEAFVQSGLADPSLGRTGTLADLQKSLEEAAQVMATAMKMAGEVEAAIAIPAGAAVAESAADREIAALWEEYDRESDPAKREGIMRKLQEKDPNRPVQAAL